MTENNSLDKSFYDELWELLETELSDTVLCDQMTDKIYDLIKERDAAPWLDITYDAFELTSAPE